MMAAAELAGFEHRRYRRLLLEQIPAGLRHLSPLSAEIEAVEGPQARPELAGPHTAEEEVSSCPG